MIRYRNFVLTWGLIVSSSAWALTPSPLGAVHGTVVSNANPLQSFDFDPGTLDDCGSHAVDSWMVYDCAVLASRLSVTDAPLLPEDVTFTRVTVFYKPLRGGDFLREYVFFGNLSEADGSPVESPVRLTFWIRDSDERHALGALELLNFNVSLSLQGMR
jgi:hypothetical protein